jgi:hypothetical protein
MCSGAHFAHSPVCYHKDDRSSRDLPVNAPTREPETGNGVGGGVQDRDLENEIQGKGELICL